MTGTREAALKSYLKTIGRQVLHRLETTRMLDRLPDGPIKDWILEYSRRGGKYLRPGLACAATGTVGGDPEDAIGIACAIEMTHTWTLVHDDIIDRDSRRRNGMTMHEIIRENFARWSETNTTLSSEHLGHSIALLIGDAQHGMAMEIMTDEGLNGKLPADLVLFLISELEGAVLPALLTGEVSDIEQTGISLDTIEPGDILTMLKRKTGALIRYSVMAGGFIGMRTRRDDHPWIRALYRYSGNLGLAFQLRDDILGIIGDTKQLGKPIGSDFREGKRTLAVKYAYDNLSESGKKQMLERLGKADMSAEDVMILRNLVAEGRGVEQVETLSETLIGEALESLKTVPASPYRDILESVAEYTISRQL